MAYPRIEGERLDVVLQKLRNKGEATPLDGAEEFEALLKRAGGRTASHGAIESQLIDYLMPIIQDGSIFHESRTISLLEFLRDNLIPQWGGTAEMTDLAIRVIDDEIGRYRNLRERRQDGIAA
jgi:hypothetical protein